MISRRAFLSALAALPFVGKLIPQQPTCAIEANIASWPKVTPFDSGHWDARNWYPTPMPVPFATLPSNITDVIVVDDRLCVMCSNGRAYVVDEDGSYKEIKRPAAEWDRKYQSNDAT